MFNHVKYIQNSFSIAFPRQIDIRRRANDFEDKLGENPDLTYGQPQVIPIPDELDPEMPRLIFSSKHGSSQIIISQINLILNVNYSPDWQVDIARGKKYLLKRMGMLFQLLSVIKDIKFYFSGLSTRVMLPTEETDHNIIKNIASKYIKNCCLESIHEINIKLTSVVNSNYFSNIVIQNYRTWIFGEPQQNIVRLPNNMVNERGIQISGDMNDRYAFNERNDYYSNEEAAKEIFNHAFREIDAVIDFLKEASS